MTFETQTNFYFYCCIKILSSCYFMSDTQITANNQKINLFTFRKSCEPKSTFLYREFSIVH
jgi:hypothetical protein